MNWQADDSDPTVVKRLSPRTRTALAVQEPDEDPTVVVQRNVMRLPEQPAAASGSPLQSTAVLLQQLEPDPERRLARAAAPLLLIVAQLRNSVERADVPALRR